MKSIKKLFFILLISVLTVGLFAGCSNDNEDLDATTETDENIDASKPDTDEDLDADEPETDDNLNPDEPETDVDLDTNAPKPMNYEDGTYYAEEDEFNENTGWKYNVTIEVEDGFITSAIWNGTHVDGGKDKITLSEDGEYVMVEGGTPWHEQAAAAEEFLIANQAPASITYNDDEGHTDDIAGVSIHVKEFFSLAEEALEEAKMK